MWRQNLAMEYMTYNNFNEMRDKWFKVWGHPYNAVAVPGREGMEECSLDLIFF